MGVSSLEQMRRHNSSSSPCKKAHGKENVRHLSYIQRLGNWPVHRDFQVAMFELVPFE